MPDITVRFHRSQWHNLPYDAQRLISQYVGPAYPDKDGVMTLVIDEDRWMQISAACAVAKVENN